MTERNATFTGDYLCTNDATIRLKTGDRVLVDGGRGTIEILEQTASG